MTDETPIQEFVHAVVASPAFDRDGICFAAWPSGLYYSDDRGDTWQPAYAALQQTTTPLPTAAVALSPDFERDRSVFAGVPGAVLRSEDGGHMWQVAALTSPPPFVSVLAVSPNYAQDGTLFAGTVEDGVFRSADRGMHWAAWNFGLLDLNVLALAVSPQYIRDETLFVGTDSGIFRSSTGGRAWREVDAGAAGQRSTDFAPVLCLAVSPQYGQDGTVFAGTEAHGLYRTDDRGRSWRRVGVDTITGAVNSILLAPEYPARPHILALLNDAILVSRDDGRTWIAWPAGQRIEDEDTLTCLAAPLGIGDGASLLVGTANGQVLRL